MTDTVSKLEMLGRVEIKHRQRLFAGVTPWYAGFEEETYIGGNGVLTSVYGDGETPDLAVQDLFNQLLGLPEDLYIVTYMDSKDSERIRVRCHWTYWEPAEAFRLQGVMIEDGQR